MPCLASPALPNPAQPPHALPRQGLPCLTGPCLPCRAKPRLPRLALPRLYRVRRFFVTLSALTSDGGFNVIAISPRAVAHWIISRLKRSYKGLRKRWFKPAWERAKAHKFDLQWAGEIANQLVANLRLREEVIRCSIVGSIRRREAIVSDIDLVVASNRPVKVIQAFFSSAPGVYRHCSERKGKAGMIGPGGIRIELLIVPPDLYGIALLATTGTRDFVRAVDRVALEATGNPEELRFEHGDVKVKHTINILRRLMEVSDRVRWKAVLTEEDVFETLGMKWIHPTRRKGIADVEAARGPNRGFKRRFFAES
jgi:DNA polymerase beta thumb